jgi:hypothetical protein
MSEVKMSGDTSHEYKLLQYKHYNRMEKMKNDKAREAFKRPAYQTEVANERT